MPDLASISAALSSVKAAIGIAKLLKDSDFSLEKAEMKLKLADLLSSLADAKIEIVEVQEMLIEKDKRITELQEAFEIKDTLIRYRDAYYLINAEGKAIGVPYCLRCWEVEHKKRQLVYGPNDNSITICAACSQKYDALSTRNIQAM